jgi:hypothetical protein
MWRISNHAMPSRAVTKFPPQGRNDAVGAESLGAMLAAVSNEFRRVANVSACTKIGLLAKLLNALLSKKKCFFYINIEKYKITLQSSIK